MASTCGKLFGRTSIPSLRSAIRSKTQAHSLHGTPLSGTGRSASSPPSRPFPTITRSPSAALRCVQSLLPLHSAVAAARLTSCLSLNSRDCRALTQGTLCCTSPGL